MGGPVVIGIDAGFTATGVAIVELNPQLGETVLGLELIRTEKDNKKRHTLAADDNMRRTREIYRQLRDFAVQQNCVAFAMEAESPMRNASAAMKVSKAHAAVGCLAEQLGLPIVQASPQRIKKVLCGSQKASKEEVESALLARYGNQLEDLFDGPDGMREHPFDALGSIVVALDSEVLRMARQMARVA